MDQQSSNRKTSYDAGFYLSVGLAASLFIILSAFEFTRHVPNELIKMESAIIGQEILIPGDTSDQYVEYAEENASFPGGFEAMVNHIMQNMMYPPEAVKQQVEGKVYVQFIVEKDGRLTNISVSKGLSEECNKEALRVVKAFPNWEPARDNGKPVRQLMTLPVMFKLKS